MLKPRIYSQGTGAVILSGFINAVKQSGVPLTEHRIVFFGAGSAGVGVAQQLKDHIALAGGVSEEKARSQFWMVDSKGLITSNRGDKLQEHKVAWARKDNGATQIKKLLDVYVASDLSIHDKQGDVLMYHAKHIVFNTSSQRV